MAQVRDRRLCSWLPCLIVVLVVSACGASQSSHPNAKTTAGVRTRASIKADAPPSGAPAGTFVSLDPACACSRHTSLALFSLRSGRLLRRLTVIPPGGNESLAAQATHSGQLFLTATSGPYCEPRYRRDMECPRFTPDSCRNNVETFSPGQRRFQRLFSVRGADAIGQAVPNPTGTEVALSIERCLGLHGINGLFIRNLRTGATRPVTSSHNRCDAFGPAAWNSTGTKVLFPFARAGKPMLMAGGIGCPQGAEYLALAPTSGVTSASQLELLRPGRGCIFYTAAFDRRGFVATEGCAHGSPKGYYSSNLGHAYLLQYSPQGQLKLRIPLRLGLEQSVVASVPGTDNVLITQDQPANQAYPERDWVWEFNGKKLHLIRYYKAVDAAQVLAVPW